MPAIPDMELDMDIVLQLFLLMLSVCLGAAMLVRRTGSRSEGIEAGHVSTSWLAEHRIRTRAD